LSCAGTNAAEVLRIKELGNRNADKRQGNDIVNGVDNGFGYGDDDEEGGKRKTIYMLLVGYRMAI